MTQKLVKITRTQETLLLCFWCLVWVLFFSFPVCLLCHTFNHLVWFRVIHLSKCIYMSWHRFLLSVTRFLENRFFLFVRIQRKSFRVEGSCDSGFFLNFIDRAGNFRSATWRGDNQIRLLLLIVTVGSNGRLRDDPFFLELCSVWFEIQF